MQCIKDTWLKLKMPALLKILTTLDKEMKVQIAYDFEMLGSQFLSQKS